MMVFRENERLTIKSSEAFTTTTNDDYKMDKDKIEDKPNRYHKEQKLIPKFVKTKRNKVSA